MKKKSDFREKSFGFLFGLGLTAFTAYSLLDTFVIPKSYQTVSAAERTSQTEQITADQSSTSQNDSTESSTALSATELSTSGQDSSVVSSDNVLGTYTDSGATITVSEYRVEDTSVYVADVVLAQGSDISTALANDTYGKNIKAATSEIASQVDAVLAVNGDFYGAQNDGYVIRNGVLYRDTSGGNEDLVIMEDGSFQIIQEDEITAEELLEEGAVQVLSFGPALVEDGEVSVTSDEEVGKAKASNPRTAVGILGENHYLFVVSDGRTSASAGLTLYQLAEFMESLGCETAYNLDGGGSSTMYFNGEVINQPTTNGKTIQERSVSDIVYIGKSES